MKAVYIFVVIMGCVTVTMANSKRNALESNPEEMHKSNDISKRGECKDNWFKVICKLMKKVGKCDSSKGKAKCAETCGHCNPCQDIYTKAKCLYLEENHKCYTDEARENCGTTCQSCGKACKNYAKACGDEKVLEELCTIKSGGFLLCPRGCNLCIDRD